jgi:hypothetical protein
MLFLANHVDMLVHNQLAIGREQLLNGYSGRIRDSKASFEEDKRMILQEIRETGAEELADQTIAVLLKSGVSTKSLRSAYDLGVDITGVGVVKWK